VGVGEVCQPGQQADIRTFHNEMRYPCPGSRPDIFPFLENLF
jgi:hypothetical protein